MRPPVVPQPLNIKAPAVIANVSAMRATRPGMRYDDTFVVLRQSMGSFDSLSPSR